MNAMVKDSRTKNFKIVKKKLKSKKSNARSTSPISESVKNGVKTGLVKKNNTKKQLHNCDIAKGKRQDQHKNEDREKSNMTQNIS